MQKRKKRDLGDIKISMPPFLVKILRDGDDVAMMGGEFFDVVVGMPFSGLYDVSEKLRAMQAVALHSHPRPSDSGGMIFLAYRTKP